MAHSKAPLGADGRLSGQLLRVGFIGLGNVGGKLAGSLQRNGFPLTPERPEPSSGETVA